MRLPESPPLTDAADLRFRMATLKAGVWLGLGMIAAGMAYFALTWDDGNRPLLAATGLAVAVTDLGILLLPMKRIVAGRWRELFFLAWTLSNVAVLLLLGALDPTVPSPLSLPLMMPMLFAGMSYPPASARICCGAAVLGYSVEALVIGQDFAFSAFFAMVLLWTAGMCLWQARNRERQHDELERQRDELERQRDELARVSLTDPLTDALNRRGFEARLGRELADAARSGRPLMLAVLDLDNFKGVNDRAGHGAGDELLCETVARLGGSLRPLDVVGRLGGDEFAVLFPGAGDAHAEALVDRLRDALAGRVAASFGYSCFPTDGVNPEELFKQADLRLYAAKSELPRRREDKTLELMWATALTELQRRAGTPFDADCVAALTAAVLASEPAPGLPASSG
jgi:diguanylate cyclase (GGDEF)-like protein